MILEQLNGKKIIIYGTGHVARKFYRALLNHGFQKQISYFVRSRDVNEDELFEGIQVRCFKDADLEENTVICLAVHESIRDEIEKTVQEKTGQYIWIYPFLYRLMFGEPEQESVEVPVSMLLKGFDQDLRLGVRLAAIEAQDGISPYGSDYYVRAQQMHCSRDTAVQRLKQFQKLIDEWKQTGCRKGSLLTFNRNYGVIDGNHRLAMAIYTGQETICGDVYPTDLSVRDIHGCEPMLTKELLMQYGFSESELQRLEDTQRRYLQRYEHGNRERNI